MESGDKRKECCKQAENLELQQSDKPDLETLRCKICGCRHFGLSVDVGRLELRGARMGG